MASQQRGNSQNLQCNIVCGFKPNMLALVLSILFDCKHDALSALRHPNRNVRK